MKHVGWRVGEEGTRCHLIAGVNPVDMASGKWMRVERHEGPCSDSKHRDIVQWIVVVLEVRGGLGQDGGCEDAVKEDNGSACNHVGILERGELERIELGLKLKLKK